MRQLALGISPPQQSTLENFIPGANAELLAMLKDLAAGKAPDATVYIWGERGSGRSHLLRACAAGGVHAADDVETLDEARQIDLFNRINEARQSGGRVLAAGNAPPAQLPLREDLRSRLAWGLVYQVKPLSDEERAQYLRAEARRRGIQLADEVVGYLLTRARRDLPTLSAILDKLDRASLEQKRHVTVPLARELLASLEK